MSNPRCIEAEPGVRQLPSLSLGKAALLGSPGRSEFIRKPIQVMESMIPACQEESYSSTK